MGQSIWLFSLCDMFCRFLFSTFSSSSFILVKKMFCETQNKFLYCLIYIIIILIALVCLSMCVCVCLCVRMYANLSVCVCVPYYCCFSRSNLIIQFRYAIPIIISDIEYRLHANGDVLHFGFHSLFFQHYFVCVFFFFLFVLPHLKLNTL